MSGSLADAALVAIHPLRAGAFGATVVGGLLLLQYAHRRQPFILFWAGGWLLLAPSMLLLSFTYSNALVGRGVAGTARLLDVGAALLFVWSGDLYRQTDYVQLRRVKMLWPVAVWFLVIPLIFETRLVLLPGYLMSAGLLAAAASMYAAVLLERRMIGAGLVAFVLLGLAISDVTTAFVSPRGGEIEPFAFELLLLNTVLYASGALGVHLLVFEDMTYELRLMNRRLETAREELLQAAITDPLTGCHNRRFFGQVIGRELHRHARFGLPLSLLFVDVNRFKAVNDTLGHEAGDRVLKYVAGFLKKRIREADYVFRWGGDEFLVLITCSGEEARRKAAALKAAFDLAPEAADLPPGIGVSVGSVEVPAGTTDLMPLVHEADARMYEDKRGR